MFFTIVLSDSVWPGWNTILLNLGCAYPLYVLKGNMWLTYYTCVSPEKLKSDISCVSLNIVTFLAGIVFIV